MPWPFLRKSYNKYGIPSYYSYGAYGSQRSYRSTQRSNRTSRRSTQSTAPTQIITVKTVPVRRKRVVRVRRNRRRAPVFFFPKSSGYRRRRYYPRRKSIMDYVPPPLPPLSEAAELSIREQLAEKRRREIEEAKMAEPNEEHTVIWAEDDGIERLLKKRRLNSYGISESKVPDSHDEYWLTSQANPQWQPIYRPRLDSPDWVQDGGSMHFSDYDETLRISPLDIPSRGYSALPEADRWRVLRNENPGFSRTAFEEILDLQNEIDERLRRSAGSQHRLYDEPMELASSNSDFAEITKD